MNSSQSCGGIMNAALVRPGLVNRHILNRTILTFLLTLFLSACQVAPAGKDSASSLRSSQIPASTIDYVDFSGLPEGVRLEHRDRVNRIRRLSKQFSVRPPQLDDGYLVQA